MFGILKPRNKRTLCICLPTLSLVFVLILYTTKPCPEISSDYNQRHTDSLDCPPDKFPFAHNHSILIAYIRKNHLRPPSKLLYNLNPKLSRVTTLETDAQLNVTAYLKNVLNHKQNGFFVESVALDGELFSQTLRLEKQDSWDGLLIEPLPSLFNMLKKTQRKAWIADVCLAGEIPKHIDVETLKHSHSRYAEVQGYYKKKIKKEQGIVQCYPLFSLISAIGLRENVIDLLHLNTGGTELEILEGIPFDHLRIRVIIVKPLGKPEVRKSISTLLQSKGYIFDEGLVAGTYMAFVLNDSMHSSLLQA